MALQFFLQWVATVNEALEVLGHTPRLGAVAYMWVSTTDPDEVFVIEKVRGPGVGVGYQVDDCVADVVSKQQIRAFLTNRGETLPALENLRIKVRPSTPNGPYNDELVIVNTTTRITQL